MEVPPKRILHFPEPVKERAGSNDEYDQDRGANPGLPVECDHQAAAKLRQLHEENEELRRERDEARRTVREAHEAGTRLTAQRDALLDALEEIHQATMKNKVVIAKYIGINFLAAIAIRKAKEGE